MDTLADNHLSLKARGRGGDTELAHVNPREKSMLKAMGGSGGINPNTGLREYQFDPVTAGLAIGLTAVSAYTSGKAAQTQAKYTGRAAEQGLLELRGAGERLDVAAETRREAAGQDYSLGLEKLSADTGFSIEDLQKQTEQSIQKSGLATSGSIEEKRSGVWRRIQSGFGTGKEGLMANLGKKMGDIEGWYEGEKARISSEKKKFERERNLASEQQDAWYLGKNLLGN